MLPFSFLKLRNTSIIHSLKTLSGSSQPENKFIRLLHLAKKDNIQQTFLLPHSTLVGPWVLSPGERFLLELGSTGKIFNTLCSAIPWLKLPFHPTKDDNHMLMGLLFEANNGIFTIGVKVFYLISLKSRT